MGRRLGPRRVAHAAVGRRRRFTAAAVHGGGGGFGGGGGGASLAASRLLAVPSSETGDAGARGTSLDNVLVDATIPELPNHYRGKVRDNYDLPDGRRIIIATDRLSAFDRDPDGDPCKGQVLTQIARFWFDATRDICPNHVIDYPGPECRRVPAARHPAGRNRRSRLPDRHDRRHRSGRCTERAGGEIYGVRFPDGLRENQKLPATIITPTTKAAEGEHDEPLTAEEIIGRGLLTGRAMARPSRRLALALFARGREIAAGRGLILVDTKYEFGLDRDGRIILADEIHTPDSSRYWLRESYDAPLRGRGAARDARQGFSAPLGGRAVRPLSRADAAYPERDDHSRPPSSISTRIETITGKSFELPSPETPIIDRIRANLAQLF